MQHTYLNKEKEYLKSFQNMTLDIETFHHKQHLLVTYVLLIDHNIEETYLYIKSGILNILKHVGVDTTKYHETMTYGWVLIVQYFLHNSKPCKSFEEFISQNTQLLDLNILYEHYSRKLIETKKARLNIIEPDVKPIQ